MRISKLIGLFAAGTLLLSTAGCPDDSGCVDYEDVSGTVSFKDDVVPIFQASCNFSVCHGSNIAQPKGNLALGPESGATLAQSDVDEVHANIVGVDAQKASFKLVVASDPGASWLLAKMEYQDFTLCEDLACDGTNCGDSMPLNSELLPEATRNTIAAWIKAGAPNN